MSGGQHPVGALRRFRRVLADRDLRRILVALGEGFGEIALLRGVPRTATVTARGLAQLYALDRDVFLSVVTAHPLCAAAAETIAAARRANARSTRTP